MKVEGRSVRLGVPESGGGERDSSEETGPAHGASGITECVRPASSSGLDEKGVVNHLRRNAGFQGPADPSPFPPRRAGVKEGR